MTAERVAVERHWCSSCSRHHPVEAFDSNLDGTLPRCCRRASAYRKAHWPEYQRAYRAKKRAEAAACEGDPAMPSYQSRGISKQGPPVPASDTPTVSVDAAAILARDHRCYWCRSRLTFEPAQDAIDGGRVYCGWGCGRIACWIEKSAGPMVGPQSLSQNPIAVRRREREEGA